jgi:methionine aminopeptidase
VISTHLVVQKGDVLKVDFGVQVKGRICDSAFTMTWEPTYDKLLEAVKAATNTGIRVSRSTAAAVFWGLDLIRFRKPASM